MVRTRMPIALGRLLRISLWTLAGIVAMAIGLVTFVLGVAAWVTSKPVPRPPSPIPRSVRSLTRLAGVLMQERYVLSWQPRETQQVWLNAHEPPVYLSSFGHHFYFWVPSSLYVPGSVIANGTNSHGAREIVLPNLPPHWPYISGSFSPQPIRPGTIKIVTGNN